MLGIMTILLSKKSLAFLEDVEVKAEAEHGDNTGSQDKQFENASHNCLVALGLYTATFFVSMYHWYVYHKRGLV